MALSSSPRKTVPLATGDEPRHRDSNLPPALTNRVFFSSVVVEGSENGVTLPDEIQELVVSLGRGLDGEHDNMSSSSTAAAKNPTPGLQFKRAVTDTAGLQSVINELVTSEQTYVKRLQILKTEYADPLRTFARRRETLIIDQYDAKILFGNIDALLPVNEAFLSDLLKMQAPGGQNLVGDVGDVALKHFKELSGFEQYKLFYPYRERAQELCEKHSKSSNFSGFISAAQNAAATEMRNRVGLRELLMEPVQRIPRYTLLFRTMLKHMGEQDPLRFKIEEAMAIASKIALAEADDPTKRASTFHCMTTTIGGFPPGLYSSSRKFVDCIDVQDIGDNASTPYVQGSTTVLHCTLLLFDDKLLIVKRPNGDKGVKELTGLDKLDKVTKVGTISSRKKSGMSTKAVLDITDVVASDPGGSSIHLFLEKPPQDQSERWSGRPFRSLVVVNLPHDANHDAIKSESHKKRFLENLWEAQAKYRAAGGKSVVLLSKVEEVENRANRTTLARTYYNVYTRTSFLRDPKKTKVVVHIDPMGTADPIPFGMEAPPYVCIRLQPISGGLCRYSVTSADADNDNAEEDIVQLERVPSRIIHTVHQFGLFQHRTGGKYSVPGTPTASRSRASIFGLDAISKNLFNSRPASAMGDFFGGTITNHRRTKSATSRSSIRTQSNSTADSSLLKSHRTESTAATSVQDDDSSYQWSQSSKGQPRKEGDLVSNTNSLGRKLTSQSLTSLSRSISREQGYDDSESSDDDEQVGTIKAGMGLGVDSSDQALDLRLDLAKQNSLRHGKGLPPLHLDIPVAETIYEEEPPEPIRQSSVDGGHWRSGSNNLSVSDLRSHSRQSNRPAGPRAASPLPHARSSSRLSANMSTDEEEPPPGPPDSESSDAASDQERPALRPSGIPRSRRQRFPYQSSRNLDATPRAGSSSSIEPLSIKKKTAPSTTYSFPVTPTQVSHRSSQRESPLGRSTTVVETTAPVMADTTTAEPQADPNPSYEELKETLSTGQAVRFEFVDNLLVTARFAREQIEGSQRSVKLMKAEIEKLPGSTAPNTPRHTPSPMEEYPPFRSTSPDKLNRSGSSIAQPVAYVRDKLMHLKKSSQPDDLGKPQTREAQQRLDEMRNLIGRRQGDIGGPSRRTPLRPGLFESSPKSRDRSGSVGDVMVHRRHLQSSGSVDRVLGSSQSQSTTQLRDHASEADQHLAKALETQESLERDLEEMAAQFKQKMVELQVARIGLAHANRKTGLIRDLLTDLTAEKDIMYESFNEELDAFFNDAYRPGDEAYNALADDLQTALAQRNTFSRENGLLQQQLLEAECQRDEWGDILRIHGLLPAET